MVLNLFNSNRDCRCLNFSASSGPRRSAKPRLSERTGRRAHCLLLGRIRKTFQNCACRQQTSLISGALFQDTKRPLTVWFLAIYLLRQAKTGLAALALKRPLGVHYPTAWLIHHKLIQAMAEREARYTLSGQVQADDAYFGGELSGGKARQCSENKIPFVVAASLTAEGHP